MTQKPTTRKFQIPEIEGGEVFVLNPDGTRIPVEPLMVSIMAKAWLACVTGGYVYEKTRLKPEP